MIVEKLYFFLRQIEVVTDRMSETQEGGKAAKEIQKGCLGDEILAAKLGKQISATTTDSSNRSVT